MARPGTKDDLIKAASEQFEKMWNVIDAIPGGAENFVFAFDSTFKGKEAHWKRDKNIRDVLVHLYEWHELLIKWIDTNGNGGNAPFLPEQYNWRTYGGMNQEIWEKHQSTSYEEARKMLHHSHEDVMKLIDSYSNDELFERGHFDWSGTNSIGAYFVSCTSSHYDWAIKKIKKIKIRV